MTTAAPTTPIEWEDYVNGFDTPESFQTAFTDGSFQETLTAYIGAQNSVMADLKAATNEQVQLAVHDMLKANGANTGSATNRLDLVAHARQRQIEDLALYNPNAAGAHLDGWFKNAGQAFQATIGEKWVPSNVREKVRDLQAYSEKVPSEGGILVPEEVRSDIMTRALEDSVMRPRATVIPMPTGKLKYPANDFTTEVGEIFGGMVFSWMDEGGTIPLTDAAFAAITLEANKLGGGALVPNELLRDSDAFSVWLRNSMPRGIAHFEDLGYLKGNGVKKPLGALHANNPALITAAKEVGQTSGITWPNVLSMFSRLLPESYLRSIWIASPDCIPEIYSMALPVGTGGSAVMFGSATGPNATQGLPQMLLGRPILWSRKTPATLGTQGDISLIDPSTYLIADTMEMRTDTSEHVAFWTDKTGFRTLMRVDGQPQMLSALTPENGGPTLSSYVQLETRG